jgi:plastocyanin
MIAAIGCNDSNSTTGGSATSPSPQASVPPAGTGGTPPKPPPPDVKAAAGTASVMGRVSFNGDPPKRREINFGPEKKCHDHHTTPPTDDSVVVSADRSVQWVLVRIVGKVPGNFPTPEKPAVLDQKGCIFTPHILAVQVGQEIDIKNSDEVLHNVRCEATVNPPFNRNLPKVGDVMKVKFDVPEVGLKIKCDVHFWMGAYIHVMPHPFFALTGENGRFVIEKLPPGTYKLEAWHEKFGKQTKDITVKDGEVFTADFEFQPK